MSQAYGAPPPPRKKGMSGCAVAILVTLCSGAVGLAVAGYGAWRALSSPTGKRVTKVVGDSAEVMYRAHGAPGAKELRMKGGCDEAFVVTGDDMAKLERDLADASMPVEVTLVTCQASYFGDAPSCESVARTYVDAVHPSGAFLVNVNKQGATKPECQMTFDSRGTPLTR